MGWDLRWECKIWQAFMWDTSGIILACIMVNMIHRSLGRNVSLQSLRIYSRLTISVLQIHSSRFF